MLGDILKGLSPTPAAYLGAARRIEAETFQELKPVNVVILSTFTADTLRPYLIVESAARGMLARPFFGPFDQLEQQVLDGNSALYAAEPHVVVIATRLEEIALRLVNRFVALSPPHIDEELEEIERRFQRLIDGLRRFTTATILVFNYADPPLLEAGLADASLDPSETWVIQMANQRVARLCRRYPDVHVFDYARMVHQFGVRHWCDSRLWYLGRIPFGPEAQLETGRHLARYLRAARVAPCKCLVVDLDNTLWGGVVGEEGVGGIALGEDYPGRVYKDFQRRLLSLRDQGLLLAVASKNNESDALQVFQSHPDCVLKLEDFASLQINWQDKATSLTNIAEELNIGADALAFFDDNPVEREWVRTKMPEVNVIEVPDSPLLFSRALNESGAFDSLVVSTEDRKRAGMYQKERARTQLRRQSVSLEDFLRQLNIEVSIGRVDKNTLPRVAQLLAKTNQFNLSTRRHSSAEIQAMMDSGAIALWMRVADRLGDNGLVAVAIAIPNDSSEWIVDTFLMSCRVVGRQVETALLSTLSTIVRRRCGQRLIGEYIPTPKNGLASAFYSAHGFEPVDSDGRLWRWDLSQGDIPPPTLMDVRVEDDSTH